MESAGVGDSFGPYQVEELLGQGAMGFVFRAIHKPLKRAVALKLLREGDKPDGTLRARFEREMKVASTLRHPNLVRTFDAGVIDNIPYIALELLEGRTLQDVLAEGKQFPWPLAADTVARLAAGLACLHENGILHRDIKPSNIFICASGAPKFIDFGLARAADSTLLTEEGYILGTPLYLAPEIVTNATWTPRSDLWGLGCVLYLMLTGQLPIQLRPGPNWMVDLAQASIQPPAALDPAVPPAISDLVMKLLDRDPRNRTGDAATLAAALQREVAGVSAEASLQATRILQRKPAVPAPAPVPAQAHPRRLRTAAIVTVVLTVLSALALALPRFRWTEGPYIQAWRLAEARGLAVAERELLALAAQGSNPSAKLQLGLVRFWQGRIRTAEEDLLAAAERSTDPCEGAIATVALQLVREDWRAQRNSCADALSKFPYSADLNHLNTADLPAIGPPEAIARECRRVAAHVSAFSEAQGRLASAFLLQGQDADAEALIQTNLAADPRSAFLHATRGALLLRKLKHREAEEAFRRALALDPASAKAVLGVADCLLGDYRLKDAEEFCVQRLKNDETLCGVAIRLCTAIAGQGRFEEAWVQLERHARADPECVNLYTWLSLPGLPETRRLGAGAVLERLFARDPTRCAFMGEYVTLLHQQSRFQDVFRICREHFGRHPECRDPRLWKFGNFLDVKEVHSVQARLRERIRRAPADCEAALQLMLMLGMLMQPDAALLVMKEHADAHPCSHTESWIADRLYERKAFGEAEKHARRALQLDPLESFSRYNMGRFAALRKDYVEELECYRRGAAGRPSSSGIFHALADALRRQGRLVEAERATRTGLGLNPWEPLGLAMRSEILLQMGKIVEAREQISWLLKIDPTSDRAHEVLADLSYRTGDLAESARHYRWLFDRNPDSEPYATALASILLGQDLLDQAEAVCLAAQKRHPRSFGVLMTLANIAARRRAWLQSANFAREAIAIDGKNSAAHIMLAGSLQELGRTTDAIEAYRAALVFTPQSVDARVGLTRALKTSRRIREADEMVRSILALHLSAGPDRSNVLRLLNELGDLENIDRLLRDEAHAGTLGEMELSYELRALEGLQRYTDAEALCRKALAKDPKSRRFHTRLAAILECEGRLVEAVNERMKAERDSR